MDKSSLGNRMKEYERVPDVKLTRRTPVIIRLDGKAFSKFTKGFDKPFDLDFQNIMLETTKYLCENIQGCKLGYTQSDEISLLLVDYERLETDAWFGNRLQKIVSTASALATVKFNQELRECWLNTEDESEKEDLLKNKLTQLPTFDARAFNVPKEEVVNCFLWRQNDATKNSITCYAQTMFSHKELMNKNGNTKQEMMFQRNGFNWNNAPTIDKRGACVVKTENGFEIDKEIPIFSQDRDYIERFIYFEV